LDLHRSSRERRRSTVICWSPRAYAQNHEPKLHQMFSMAVARSSFGGLGGIAVCYALPVLWMTSHFPTLVSTVACRYRCSDAAAALSTDRRCQLSEYRKPKARKPFCRSANQRIINENTATDRMRRTVCPSKHRDSRETASRSNRTNGSGSHK